MRLFLRQSSEVNEGIFIPLDEMIVPQRFWEIPFHFARGSAYVSLDVLAMLYEKEFASYLVADGRTTRAIPVTDAWHRP